MQHLPRNVPMLLAMLVSVGIGLLGLASPAQAGFRLRVDDLTTGTGIVISDGVGGDINPQTGVLQFIGPIGAGFSINITTGISKPVLGGVNNYAELELNSINVQSLGVGTIRITLEDTDYIGGPNGPLLLKALIGGVLTAPGGSSIHADSWVNASNLVPDLGADTYPESSLAAIGGTPAGSVNGFGTSGFDAGPGAFSASGSAVFTKSGPYSMFSQVTVVFSGAGIVSFDEDQQVLPAPPNWVLASSGLAIVGLGFWWRRKQQLRIA